MLKLSSRIPSVGSVSLNAEPQIKCKAETSVGFRFCGWSGEQQLDAALRPRLEQAHAQPALAAARHGCCLFPWSDNGAYPAPAPAAARADLHASSIGQTCLLSSSCVSLGGLYQGESFLVPLRALSGAIMLSL